MCKKISFGKNALLQEQVEVQNSTHAREARDKPKDEGRKEGNHDSDDCVGHGVASGFGSFGTSAGSEKQKRPDNEHDERGQADEAHSDVKDTLHDAFKALDGGDLVYSTAIAPDFIFRKSRRDKRQRRTDQQRKARSAPKRGEFLHVAQL